MTVVPPSLPLAIRMRIEAAVLHACGYEFYDEAEQAGETEAASVRRIVDAVCAEVADDHRRYVVELAEAEAKLAQALGYPKYGEVDPDPPGDPEDYVIGEHTVVTLAMEAERRMKEQRAELAKAWETYHEDLGRRHLEMVQLEEKVKQLEEQCAAQAAKELTRLSEENGLYAEKDAIFDSDGAFLGFSSRKCGEHRTVGSHRAWCHDCGEWCYPHMPCRLCQPQ